MYCKSLRRRNVLSGKFGKYIASYTGRRGIEDRARIRRRLANRRRVHARQRLFHSAQRDGARDVHQLPDHCEDY